MLSVFVHPVQEVVKTLEAKRRARAEEYYKRKKYLQVRKERGCGLVLRFPPSVFSLTIWNENGWAGAWEQGYGGCESTVEDEEGSRVQLEKEEVLV